MSLHTFPGDTVEVHSVARQPRGDDAIGYVGETRIKNKTEEGK